MNISNQIVNYFIYDSAQGATRPPVCPYVVRELAALSDAVREAWGRAGFKERVLNVLTFGIRRRIKGRLISHGELEGRLSGLKTQVSASERIKRAWREYKSRQPRPPVKVPERPEQSAAETIQRAWRRSKAKRLLPDQVRQEVNRKPTSEELAQMPQLRTAGHREALARVVNVSNVLKDSHYLFVHGVDHRISMLHQLLTAVKSAAPSRVFCPQPAVSLQYTLYESSCANVEAYLSSHGKPKDELAETVSVNSYFFDTKVGESALDFFGAPANISNRLGNQSWPQDATGNRCRQLIRDVTQAPSLQQWWDQQLVQLKQAAALFEEGNSLYLIAIPKATLDDPDRTYAYLSHSLGIPCKCVGLPKEEPFATVTGDYNRADERNPPSYGCFGSLKWGTTVYAQHRLMRTNLERDPSKLIFSFPADEASANEQKQEIRPLQRVLQDVARLESIGSNLSAQTIESILLRLDLSRDDELYQKGIREILYHKRQVLVEFREYLLAQLPDLKRALVQEVLDDRIPAPRIPFNPPPHA